MFVTDNRENEIKLLFLQSFNDLGIQVSDFRVLSHALCSHHHLTLSIPPTCRRCSVISQILKRVQNVFYPTRSYPWPNLMLYTRLSFFANQPFQTHDPTQPTENKNFWPTTNPTQPNPTRGSTQPTDNSGPTDRNRLERRTLRHAVEGGWTPLVNGPYTTLPIGRFNSCDITWYRTFRDLHTKHSARNVRPCSALQKLLFHLRHNANSFVTVIREYTSSFAI